MMKLKLHRIQSVLPLLAGLAVAPLALARTTNVAIQGFAFTPNSVTITAGDSVIWTQRDTVQHTVTGNTGAWGSPLLSLNQTYTTNFNTAGTFAYHCAPHPSMTGTVIVQSAPASNAPPSVTITNPPNGATFTAPATFTIQATATDTDGTVTNVQFFAGVNLLGAKTNSPFSIVASNFTAANYVLTARATDNGGLTRTSAPVNITVQPNVPPSAAITSPTNGATFTAPATFTIQATATDTDGIVTNVQFFAGGNLLGSKTNSPFSLTASNLNAGPYALTVRATDNAGLIATSAPVNVTVVLPNLPPSVSLTNPPNNSVLAAPATLTLKASATDTDGSVTNVQFFNGVTPLGAVASSPFNLVLSNLAAGGYSFTARALDNVGASATSAVVNVSVVTPGVLRFSTGLVLSNSLFPLTLSVTPGLSYALDGSTNLSNWTVLATATASSSSMTYSNPASGFLHRFFRARLLPNP